MNTFQAPEESSFLAHQNRKVKKQTRIDPKKINNEKAAEAGLKGQQKKATPKIAQTAQPSAPKPEHTRPPLDQKNPPLEQKMPSMKPNKRTLSQVPRTSILSRPTDTVKFKKTKPRNNYEGLLAMNSQDAVGQLNAGYQAYIDEEIEIGDKIDINTSEFRYMGYFSSMRKAIELVWNYPYAAARKGIEGKVGLEFSIGKEGHARRIRVVESSGFEILDRSIIEAIKSASPFSPLPGGFEKDQIVVTGNFYYVLNGAH